MKHLAFLFLFFSLFAKEPKTAVLVLYSEENPLYPKLRAIWRSYMHRDPEHFACYFLRSDPKLSVPFLVDGDTIWTKGEESRIPGILDKTLLGLQALPMEDFSYVLRTNVSSFYVFPRLLNFLKKAPEENFYCGIHHYDGLYRHETGWVCGAGILFSTDLALLLLAHQEELFNLPADNLMNIDDVIIGELFTKHQIPIQTGPFYREIYRMQDWYSVRHSIPDEVFHFRIKTGDKYRNFQDLIVHDELYKMFYPK